MSRVAAGQAVKLQNVVLPNAASTNKFNAFVSLAGFDLSQEGRHFLPALIVIFGNSTDCLI
jgi:hypothetical protein